MLNIHEAFKEAKKLHQGQFRKGCDVPYWTHLRDVAGLVKRHGGNRDQIVAGLFHDAIEDQDVTYSWVSQMAGEEVARIVSECSKSKELTGWDVRFEDYTERLKVCSYDTRLVVMADKVSNLIDIKKDFDVLGDALWSRFSKGHHTLAIQYTRYMEIFDSWGKLPDEWAKLRAIYRQNLLELMGEVA